MSDRYTEVRIKTRGLRIVTWVKDDSLTRLMAKTLRNVVERDGPLFFPDGSPEAEEWRGALLLAEADGLDVKRTVDGRIAYSARMGHTFGVLHSTKLGIPVERYFHAVAEADKEYAEIVRLRDEAKKGGE